MIANQGRMGTVRCWLVLGTLGLALLGPGAGCREEDRAAPGTGPKPPTAEHVRQHPLAPTTTAGTVDKVVTAEQRAGEGSEGLALELHLGDAPGPEMNTVERGEPITLRLVLRNLGRTARQLQCPSARTHDVHILATGGQEIWRWSRGRMFAQMVTDVGVGPGESREFRVTWDQRSSDGTPVAPGRYQAEGSIPALGGEIHSAPVPFTIR